MRLERILIIQTAFIGDAILATGVLEALHTQFPHAQLDTLVRQGNETLFTKHPFLTTLYTWDKQEGKYRSLFKLIKELRKQRYDLVVNLHRFASSGMVTWLMKSHMKVCFDKNPLAFICHKRFPHEIGLRNDGSYLHEIQRNHTLISEWCGDQASHPKLYPENAGFRPQAQRSLKRLDGKNYVVMAPNSVWFTKAFPEQRWIELMNQLTGFTIVLIGGKNDRESCDRIIGATQHKDVMNMCGELNLLESAALMRSAQMNYVNDSAPMHLASSVNAPVTAIFCSTVPGFGFGPLSDDAKIIESNEALACRPCGLHGYRSCPKKHFKCATTISMTDLVSRATMME